MRENILVTKKLCKVYNGKTVVNNINMTIKKGDIYGLIGKNGAGKTTLIRMILSLSNIDCGEIELFSKVDLKERIKEHSRIGSIIETPAFYPNLTAKQNLEYYRIQRGIVEKSIVDEVLEIVGLKREGKKKFKDYSLGMKQRLGLALALLNNPDFLILDEPTNGLDPIGIKEFRDILLRLNNIKNTTILISSHILLELSQIVSTYGFINNGVLIEEISSEELNEKCRSYILIKVDDSEKTSIILEKELNCKDYEVLNNNLIRVYDYLEESNVVNRALVSGGVNVYALETRGSNLEDYFLDLIEGGKYA